MLVVLTGPAGDTRQWADTVLTLRKAITLPRVEVIAYSKQGFVNGLRNHSPFLLDVAVDGILLHDLAGLSNEIAAARRYIEDRHIQRLRPGSWRFPVHYRRSTSLSERSNED